MRPQSVRYSNAIGYEDFQPEIEWNREEEATILLLHLPGFSEEQTKYNRSNRIIQVSGERAIGNNVRRRFNQTFGLPENCKADKIFSRFENGIFKIIMPKETVTQVGPSQAAKTAQEAPLSPKAAHKEGKEKSVSSQIPQKGTTEPTAQKDQKDHDETPTKFDSTTTAMKQADNDQNDEKKETSKANGMPESKETKIVVERSDVEEKGANKDNEGLLIVKVLVFVVVAVGVIVSYRLGSSRKLK